MQCEAHSEQRARPLARRGAAGAQPCIGKRDLGIVALHDLLHDGQAQAAAIGFGTE